MKKEVGRILICGLHDPQNTHIDIVSYDDNTTDIDIVGNKAGMILALCHQACNFPEEFQDIRNMLTRIANGVTDQFLGEGKLVSGTFDSVFERLKNTENEEEKACGFREFIKALNDEDALLKLLSMIKQLPDFNHKNDILRIGADKLRNYFHA